MSKNPNSAAVFYAWAPAKINLGLRVLGRRRDGYHDLLSLMVPVSLSDHLRLEPCQQGVELRCPNSSLPTGKDNLVYRAAHLILSACHRSEGVRIELTKKIPVAAGLGGGSSDAAATLMAVNQHLGRPLDHRHLLDLGVQLGADVPFFLLGRPAMAEGIGDRLTPLDTMPTLWTVLLYPRFEVSTRWAYENLTLTTRSNGSKFYSLFVEEVAAYRELLTQGKQLTCQNICSFLANDFEALVFGRYPLLHDFRQALLGAGAGAATMSGSGPTLVGVFDSEGGARAAHQLLCSRGDADVFLAHTLDTVTAFVGKDENTST